MDRAYSILQVRSVQEGLKEVVIEGIASTPSTDRQGDVVEPMGATFSLPLVLLWMHDHSKPVGNVTFAKATAAGITFKAVLPFIADPGVLKDRVDEAIHSLRAGLIRAVSIGFRATKDGVERMANGGMRWKAWEWMELSLVAIPAQAEATISVVRAIDTEVRRSVAATPATAAAPGRLVTIIPTSKGTPMSSVSLAPKGLIFGRFAKALIAGQGSLYASQAYAEGRNWTDTPQVTRAIKDAVSAMSSADVPLAMRPVTVDFAELLRPQTIIGRVQGLRRVPFDIRMVRGTAGAVAAFVAEGQAIPVTSAGFEASNALPRRKVGAIAIITQELARSSEPSAELVMAADITAAIALTLDKAFIDVANMGVDGVKPASVTSSGFKVASSGATVAQVDADLAAVVGNFNTENIGLAAPVWVMAPVTALALSMLRGSGGVLAYPGMAIRGGSLLGIPVITSAGAAGQITLMDASEIDVADDGDAEIDASEESMVQMDSAPDSPVLASTVMTALWQNNLVGIRGLRFMNWLPRRAKAVGTITGVTY